LWDLFNTTGIETQVFNLWTNYYTSHWFKNILPLSRKLPYTVEADILYSGLNDRELNSNDYRSKHSTYVEVSYPLIRDQK
jgi:hypothetical protein